MLCRNRLGFCCFCERPKAPKNVYRVKHSMFRGVRYCEQEWLTRFFKRKQITHTHTEKGLSLYVDGLLMKDVSNYWENRVMND